MEKYEEIWRIFKDKEEIDQQTNSDIVQKQIKSWISVSPKRTLKQINVKRRKSKESRDGLLNYSRDSATIVNKEYSKISGSLTMWDFSFYVDGL